MGALDPVSLFFCSLLGSVLVFLRLVFIFGRLEGDGRTGVLP